MSARMVIDGIPETRELLRDIGGKALERELGWVHKTVGQLIIWRLGGASTGVGRGRGETIRPSASVRQVELRVGGAHRSRRVQQWGIKSVRPHPIRPHIIGAAHDIEPLIIRTYEQGVQQAIVRATRG
jgi:hypothetical protein